MTSKAAATAAQAANRVIPVHKKYTTQSTGLWEIIRRIFAVSAQRSNGIPLNPQFRNPPPGSNAPFSFIDPVTVPAGDIADNPYWKRDARRAYPRLSFVGQERMVGLLNAGREVAGELGEGKEGQGIAEGGKEGKEGKEVQVKEEREVGLGEVLVEGREQVGKVMLGEGGLPPRPSSMNAGGSARREQYNLTEENSYPEEYPCRTFS